jgi:pSer/pThr/pTyr-binding forkhead associated (FHA) protein
MNITLTVIDGPQKGTKFEFHEPDNFLLGRDNNGSNAHFRLNNDDTQVSRNHFLLEINPPDCFIRDAGSLNGTFIVRSSSKRVYFMAGRSDNQNEYESRGAKLKDNLGYSSLQRSEDRLKLDDKDVIHVGQTAILVEIMAQARHQAAQQAAESDSHCIECDASMPSPANRKRADQLCVDDFICNDCKAMHEKARRPVHGVSCCDCGCDVTSQADSDGRADELKSIALYLCPSCARKRTKGPLPVERIKDYRLLTQLGEGGFGMVFLSWQAKTNRAVALKITKEVIKDDPALVKRFKREIAVMQRLKHPKLVRLLDEGIADSGNYFFISEYLPAGSLTDYTWNNFDGILPVTKACQIYIQALEGLAFLHGKGYIHRDIKPENIILTKDASGKRIAKLGDFGLAKNYLVHGGTLTGANEWIGTIFYCPPEQILDFKHSSPASDVYAMGIAFYNSVTGQFPYDFPSREECACMIRRGDRPRDPISFILGDDKPIPIEKRLPRIDDKVAKAVNGAIVKDVKKRIIIQEFIKAISI